MAAIAMAVLAKNCDRSAGDDAELASSVMNNLTATDLSGEWPDDVVYRIS